MKIGIAGAGGIGSNVAVHLVRTGASCLKIADFDFIEESNLNRQFYFHHQIGTSKVETLKKNLLDINPKGNFQVENLKLTRENMTDFFQECDIVVEAFDESKYKTMLIEEIYPLGKLIVSASGIAHWDICNIKIKKVMPNLFVVGDFEKGIENYNTYSHKVSIAAAMMAGIVLEKGGFYEK
ncbi:sulfur carrier protein ThiS adenylyltransferase ThiF [uncultured Ilyobacter sp.]|uniref:sulfur carrier protein ThiS adenylyltransferase ThiF n=1 Tax=uncultured Ilyobacter sp. TaxID=544433 RepID=UPI0029C6ADC9|nr:sulfur carrier protein ThiS adenylyltransferase ThiF [uncultured Ilyobacter sp.]